MNPYGRFLIRLVVAVVCSHILVRIFFPATGWPAVVGFTVFFLGLVYLIEMQRRRRVKQEGIENNSPPGSS